MSEPEDYTEQDTERVHSQEPAEGAEQPGEPEPSVPHAQAPAEGESD